MNGRALALLAAILAAGCLAPGALQQGPELQDAQILAETFHLSAADGLTRTFDVVVPPNASHIHVDIELSGVAAGVTYDGPGSCSGGTQGAIGQHNQAMSRSSCDAPPAGVHPMRFDLEAGDVIVAVVVRASFD